MSIFNNVTNYDSESIELEVADAKIKVNNNIHNYDYNFGVPKTIFKLVEANQNNITNTANVANNYFGNYQQNKSINANNNTTTLSNLATITSEANKKRNESAAESMASNIHFC